MKNLSRFCACLAVFCFLPLYPALAQQPVPEVAQQHFQAGLAMIEKAEVPDDLRSALNEFEAAADLALQWPEIHYNLAQLAAETDKPAKAIKVICVRPFAAFCLNDNLLKAKVRNETVTA